MNDIEKHLMRTIKTTIISATLIGSIFLVTAFLQMSFPGWASLVQNSPEIIVVRCTKSPQWMTVTNGIVVYNGAKGMFRRRGQSVLLATFCIREDAAGMFYLGREPN